MNRDLIVHSVLLLTMCFLPGFALESRASILVDLTKNDADVQILGSVEKVVRFTFESVSSGDVNGDGMDDIVRVGLAHGGNLPVAVVTLGRNNWPKVVSSDDKSQTRVVVYLPGNFSYFYPQMPAAVGDINGDRIGDLLIPVQEGFAVLFGRKNWPIEIDLREKRPDLRFLVKRTHGDVHGWIAQATTGDINGDGIADLVLSHRAYFVQESRQDFPRSKNRGGIHEIHDEEAAWLFWGRATWPIEVNLTTQAPDSLIVAAASGPSYGRLRSFRIGDMDGDGFGDIVAGSWDVLLGHGGLRATLQDFWSTAWVIRGGRTLPRRIELTYEQLKAGSSKSKEKGQTDLVFIDPRGKGMVIEGGFDLGDFNGDGNVDAVLSFVKPSPGSYGLRKLCLLLGTPALFSKMLVMVTNDCIWVDWKEIERVGPMSAPPPLVGDYNGDGRADLFVLTRDRGLLGFFGSQSLEAEVSLHSPDVRVFPLGGARQASDLGFGFVTAIGDINGDSFDDLLILATLDRGGTVHVLLGNGPKRE